MARLNGVGGGKERMAPTKRRRLAQLLSYLGWLARWMDGWLDNWMDCARIHPRPSERTSLPLRTVGTILLGRHLFAYALPASLSRSWPLQN